MGDTEGTLRITYRDRETGSDITLDFGAITQITGGMNKAVSTIPLVSMGADRAFQLETGNTLTYTISFKRKSPNDYDNESSDTTLWSNAHWYHAVTALADRWQMRTDGCRLTFVPSMTNPYTPEIDENGYIKMLSRRYNNKFNELIEGTIQFIVGTMYVLSPMKSLVPSQQKYRTLILKSGFSTDTGDGKRYSLRDVIYSIPDGQNTLIGPSTPAEWTMYVRKIGKGISKWNTGAKYLPVGKNMSIQPFGDVITLTASWSD